MISTGGCSPRGFPWRLIRVTAWTFRFINNCKQDDKAMKGELTPEEVHGRCRDLPNKNKPKASIQGRIFSIDKKKGNSQ